MISGGQLCQRGLVGVEALALIEHWAVPEQVVIFKGAQDTIRCAGNLSRRVNVINT